MSGKKLQVGDESFIYPIQGSDEWGEEAGANGWAGKVTEVLASLFGPHDILPTESPLVNGGSGNINGLKFDTAAVKQVTVQAVIKRTYADATPTEAEAVVMEGAYNGSDFLISAAYTGDDTGVEIDVDPTGQFTYTAEDKLNTDSLTIKFSAKALTNA
jgi:hypothetical protein